MGIYIFYLIFILYLNLELCFSKPESSISMASTFGCDSKKKIEVKKMLNTCLCSDDSECVWTTARRPVYGCPCPVSPLNNDYQCVQMSIALGCSDNKIECNNQFGQCECQEGGLCIWNNENIISGCPCQGNFKLKIQQGGYIPKQQEPSKNTKNPKKNKSKRIKQDL